jgi:ABC-type Fe3+-siderophore transport system permease subunit
MGLDSWRDGIEGLLGDALGIFGVCAIAFTLFLAIKAATKGTWKETGKFVLAGVVVACLAFGGMALMRSLANTAQDTVEQTKIGDTGINKGTSWDQLSN